MFKRLLMSSLIIVGINAFAGVYPFIGSETITVSKDNSKKKLETGDLLEVLSEKSVYGLTINTDNFMIQGFIFEGTRTFKFIVDTKNNPKAKTKGHGVIGRYKMSIVDSIFLAPYINYNVIKQDSTKSEWTRVIHNTKITNSISIPEESNTNTSVGVSIGYIFKNDVDSYVMVSYCIDDNLNKGDHNDHVLLLDVFYRFDNKVILGASYGEAQSNPKNVKKVIGGGIYIGWAFF